MTVNLATSYQTKPSPPRSSEIAFYAPGCADFLFRSGQDAKIVCLPYLRALGANWSLSHNLVTKPLFSGRAEAGFDNGIRIDVPQDDLTPGFYDLRVKVRLTDEQFLEGITTFGWRVDEMPIHAVRPPDFDSFWKKALNRLDAIPPEPAFRLEKILRGKEIDAYNLQSAALPENYDPEGKRFDEVEVYRVRFASDGGRTVEGWFSKPVGAGPFPALLILPGGGNGPRPAPVEHARHGYASLDIQVHGNPVDADRYDRVPPEAPEKPEDFIHYGIYLNALQAVRALKQLPGVDTGRVGVLGGSQGGRLSVVVAALDRSIKAAIPAITHYSYLPWLRWTKALNAAGKSGGAGFAGEDSSQPVPADSYLDVLNFAPLVRCPVMMNAGLIDPISSPVGIQAAYRLLSGPKEIVALPNTGHDWSPAFDRAGWRWLAEILGSPSKC